MGAIDWLIFGVMLLPIAVLVGSAYRKWFQHARLAAASTN